MWRVQVPSALGIDLREPEPPIAEVQFAARLPSRTALSQMKPTQRAPQHKPLGLGAAARQAAEHLGAQQRPFAAAALGAGDMAALSKVVLRRWFASAWRALLAQQGDSSPSGAATNLSRSCWSERQAFGLVGMPLRPRRRAMA